MNPEIDTIVTDLNGVLMFGHDRLDENQDFAATYRKLGGARLRDRRISDLINESVRNLTAMYEDRSYDERFPTVVDYLQETTDLPAGEVELLSNVIAHHEIGTIEPAVAERLRRMSQTFQIVLLSNLWSDSRLWLEYFQGIGIDDCFTSMIFSSDHGINKPSEQIFNIAFEHSGTDPSRAVMIGDSYARDIVPAKALGMSTIWINNQQPKNRSAADSLVSDFLSVA